MAFDSSIDDKQKVFRTGVDTWKVFADCSKAAAALNRRFRKYPQAELEASGSEGIFEFEQKDLAFVKAVLKASGLE